MQNTQQYITQLTDYLKDEIECSINGRILFGAICGSYSLGLQNSSSDIDYYIVVDEVDYTEVRLLPEDLVIGNKMVHVEFICIPYNEILKDISQYIKCNRRYPTALYRSIEETEKNLLSNTLEKPDFKRGALFRILLSDVMFNKPVAYQKLQEFSDGIRVIDIIDYQYTRLRGNYMEKVEGKEKVPLRKYLYMIHQVCTCIKLMQSNKKPIKDFFKLIDDTIRDDVLKNLIQSYYDSNKFASNDKRKEMVDNNEMLNLFLKENMDNIETYLRENQKSEEVLMF